ncbi:MAG TPA: GNAT family N-acetyltransferase [Candidatus Eisenbacteria bacterium]|jgi:RimJ/RimL family protein N-acetyltransferase
MQIRPLLPADAADFHALRLRGLREVPSAFGSSYEEEHDRPVEAVAERIATNRDGFILGAFEGVTLVGIVGMQREPHLKHAHKMVLWGMYVVPDARGRGVGRQLVDEALRQAFARPGIRQVNLGVNAANAPALALYQAAGFTPFGLEHGCMIVDGVLQDEVYMVCVRPGG